MSVEMKESMGPLLGARHVDQHSKYLGLPTLIGRSKKQVFSTIKERMPSRMKGWKERSLTKAGREVLLKSVIHAIPTYNMSCFVLPHSLCVWRSSKKLHDSFGGLLIMRGKCTVRVGLKSRDRRGRRAQLSGVVLFQSRYGGKTVLAKSSHTRLASSPNS